MTQGGSDARRLIRGGVADHSSESGRVMAGRQNRRKRSRGTYLSPGVYVEEVSSGAKPIEAVGTAVAAFIGFARRQPVRAVVTAVAILAATVVVVRATRN
jgi:hypothetical protein